jgi:DNA-binding NtrC family response regulator
VKPSILLVDDEPGIQLAFSKYLSKSGYYVEPVSCLAEARKALLSRRFDAVLLDLILPDGNGLDWIGDVRENRPDMAVIVITGAGDIPMAVEAMRRGADNFLTKPINMPDLDVFLRKSLEIETLRRRHLAQQRLTRKDKPYFGKSSAMKNVIELLKLAANNESAVLVYGETGTGKGVLARWIHDHSQLSEHSFVEVNCSSLRGELLASELFGHAKGAFTSAVKDQKGLIEVADGGTLFLDEIADMDLKVQAQFLKVIEEKQYRRLGEVKVRRSDFRLICATNRNLLEETKNKRFREDLYFRINIFPIFIPPLRERPEDIPGLVHHLLRAFGLSEKKISKDVMDLLLSYGWPGNIREVRNVLERALLLSQNRPLAQEYFPGLRTRVLLKAKGTKPHSLGEIEATHIRAVLDRFNGDTKKASKELGVSRATLYRKLKKYKYSKKK